jgi:hypothetical protein
VDKSPTGAAVFSLVWMCDEQHLITLDERGACRVWSCAEFEGRGTGDVDDTLVGSGAGSSGSGSDKAGGTVPEPSITYTLGAEDFFRTQNGERPREATLQPLVPMRVMVHPCVSWTGCVRVCVCVRVAQP